MWPAEPKVWTVAEATGRIEDAIAADPVLQSILIRGEISNYKRHLGPHLFHLKDARGACARLVSPLWTSSPSSAMDLRSWRQAGSASTRLTEIISCM